MKLLEIPKDYQSSLDLLETERAIKKAKDFFENELSEVLHLTRVSAPLFVQPDLGLNDNLNGYERPVAFDILEDKKNLEIVHSLAKWKRYMLYEYNVPMHEGIYADMDAIRRDEELDNLHSIYVDQWDWEKSIQKNDRTVQYLKDTVTSIYRVFQSLDAYLCAYYPALKRKLTMDITFLTTQQLEDRYPDLTPKEREYECCKEYGAVFLMQIGKKLASGNVHDGRAPDYDDWELNGDILFYNELLDCAFEMSSMGIRVDENSLLTQLKEADAMERASMLYHKSIQEKILPYSIGGGIGQSRICMFFLEKAHIGEVQSSYWPHDMIQAAKAQGVNLL